MWQHVKLSDVSLRTHPGYSLVPDEDVKNPKQANKVNVKPTRIILLQISPYREVQNCGLWFDQVSAFSNTVVLNKETGQIAVLTYKHNSL